MELACRSSWSSEYGCAIADRPARRQLIGFVVPAIQNAEAEHAVHRRFHAARAASLLAAARSIQPQVHALHHLARHLYAVIFDKHQPLRNLRIPRERHDVAYQRLAGLILGMRFTGDHHLHRHFGIVENPLQPVYVTK